ncbi:MAG: carboxymuconolactone decarboxylase family protein [Candidatus Promineifilaceae bacterium]
MRTTREKLNEISSLIGKLRADYPSETDALLRFMNKAEGGKALTIREKELINVGLAVAAQCEWCIAIHVQHAIEAGASRDEVVEAGFMAVVMHGGPALMYLIPLLEAVDELLAETESSENVTGGES